MIHRASIDWERVKENAAEILEELAFATPELKDLTLMPGGSMRPHNVLPIGFGYPLLLAFCVLPASTLASLFI